MAIGLAAAADAIKDVHRLICRGYTDVVDADLSKYFNTIPQFDIKGLFDNIDHRLPLRALEKHTECEWVRLYIGRWLTAPLQRADGSLVDDECRLRTEHAPANFTNFKHIALNLTRRAPSKDSLRLRRKVAAWDDDFLASLLNA